MSEENAKCEVTYYLFTLSQRKEEFSRSLSTQPLRVVVFFDREMEDDEILRGKKKQKETTLEKALFQFSREKEFTQ